MTTNWGADAGRWEAPRVAYQLAAAYAEGEAAGGGGCGGLPFPEAGLKIWGDMNGAERRQVCEALRAQARAALHDLGQIQPGCDGLKALETTLWLAAGCLPGCPACMVFLCRVQCGAWMLAGFAPARIAAEFAELAA